VVTGSCVLQRMSGYFLFEFIICHGRELAREVSAVHFDARQLRRGDISLHDRKVLLKECFDEAIINPEDACLDADVLRCKAKAQYAGQPSHAPLPRHHHHRLHSSAAAQPKATSFFPHTSTLHLCTWALWGPILWLSEVRI
jgi:hypothetical protein